MDQVNFEWTTQEVNRSLYTYSFHFLLVYFTLYLPWISFFFDFIEALINSFTSFLQKRSIKWGIKCSAFALFTSSCSTFFTALFIRRRFLIVVLKKVFVFRFGNLLLLVLIFCLAFSSFLWVFCQLLFHLVGWKVLLVHRNRKHLHLQSDVFCRL